MVMEPEYTQGHCDPKSNEREFFPVHQGEYHGNEEQQKYQAGH